MHERLTGLAYELSSLIVSRRKLLWVHRFALRISNITVRRRDFHRQVKRFDSVRSRRDI
jgi:hypothetical protein